MITHLIARQLPDRTCHEVHAICGMGFDFDDDAPITVRLDRVTCSACQLGIILKKVDNSALRSRFMNMCTEVVIEHVGEEDGETHDGN